ncbi:Crp/Fnr family transcriptional regulator [Paracoccus sediminicola]|uniref:Crp/Fnr family transcriptional regulator n=1 Tax=Paracoccus sediminicola TaxID=3017783 RepID=UPI0022F0DDDE|nr:Crp/Fnr family transcriptional regulator [Paracoccus sediminicola]WBU57215.1 Crp/Fnr family transcriptional regulator [Paracoccus sediminicola]
MRLADGDMIFCGNERTAQSCVIAQGMAICQLKVDSEHRKRVITGLKVPGDIVALDGFILTRLLHGLVACGPTTVNYIDHEELRRATTESPRLARLFMSLTAREAAISRQWLAASARLNVAGHLAHLLCELHFRLSEADAVNSGVFSLPILQRDLGDALGYSPVHINRAVRELRQRGLIEWHGQQIRLLDLERLTRLARFDPSYLKLCANLDAGTL